VDIQVFLDGFRDNAVFWMLTFFVGILYWAFRPRFRQPNRDDRETK